MLEGAGGVRDVKAGDRRTCKPYPPAVSCVCFSSVVQIYPPTVDGLLSFSFATTVGDVPKVQWFPGRAVHRSLAHFACLFRTRFDSGTCQHLPTFEMDNND